MNFRERLRSKKESLIIGAVVFCILVGMLFICPPYYSMNDDGMMKSILSGAYTGTPDGHAVYMKYPLTGLISMLYRITDRISWFDGMLIGCFWLSLSSVINRVVQLCKDKLKGIRAVILIAGIACMGMGLFLPHLLTLHYTLVAAMVGSCGLFLVITGSCWVSVFLLILCYCIRSQVFFLLLPFLGVAVLWRLAAKKREGLLRQLLVLAAAIGVCMLWNHLMYASDDWQHYMEYNDARTRLYDYDGLLPYEGNEGLFEEAGISRQQHRILEEYVLVLDETVDAKMQEKAADLAVAVREGKRTAGDYLIQCVKEYYYHIRYTDQPYNLLMICGYLLVFALLFAGKKWTRLLLLCCMAGGRSLIWIFLIWRGRFPERIYVSLYFLDLMILAAMAIEILLHKESGSAAYCQECAKSYKRRMFVLLGVLACSIFLVAGGAQCREMYQRTAAQAQKQKEWEGLLDYCREYPDTLFLLDVLSMVDYSGKVFVCTPGQENHLLAGGWMSDTPLLVTRLKGYPDGGALLEAPEAKCSYIVATKRDTGWLKEYFAFRFKDRSLEKTDSVFVDGVEVFGVYSQSKD